jgi:hypothetical protein
MPLPGRCVSARTHKLNYGAKNLIRTQKWQTLISSKKEPNFQKYKWFRNEQNFGHDSRLYPKSRKAVLTMPAAIDCCAMKVTNPKKVAAAMQ